VFSGALEDAAEVESAQPRRGGGAGGGQGKAEGSNYTLLGWEVGLIGDTKFISICWPLEGPEEDEGLGSPDPRLTAGIGLL
jgi:hypothetical protein